MASQFSTLTANVTNIFSDYFGIEPVTGRNQKLLEETGALIRHLLEVKLERDLGSLRFVTSTEEIEILESRLEVSLHEFIGYNSLFWEKYYARKQAAQIHLDQIPLMKIEAGCLADVARSRYPCYYTFTDVIFYSGQQSRSNYELLLQAQKCFLYGQLLGINGYTEVAQGEFRKALKLLGGRSGTIFSDTLIRLIEGKAAK